MSEQYANGGILEGGTGWAEKPTTSPCEPVFTAEQWVTITKAAQ